MFDPRLPADVDSALRRAAPYASAPALLLALVRALPLVRRVVRPCLGGPSRRGAARAALVGLLCALFTADELRRFLRLAESTEALAYELPGDLASLATLAEATTLGLERRGLVDADLFARLTAARPGRAAEIAACRALWLG